MEPNTRLSQVCVRVFNLFSTSCLPPQSTLNLTNPNFFSVLVQSVSSQVLYMKTVIGTRLVDTPTTIQPLSHRQVKLQCVCFGRTQTRHSHTVRVFTDDLLLQDVV